MTFAELLQPSCALFLDFDGTLVDIAPQPDAVVVPDGLVDTLAALRECLGGALAVVSGRPIQQIDQFLAPLQLPVAGEHGAERRDSAGEVTLLPTLPLATVQEAARAMVRQHPGLRLEIKRGSVALHYRQAPELEDPCVSAMHDAVNQTPGLVLLRGKMVVEAKPGGVSKGEAIEAFLQEPVFRGRMPLFAGDDTTDEAGFSVVQGLGGVGIKVGEGASAALQRLASPAALRHELNTAVALRKVRDPG